MANGDTSIKAHGLRLLAKVVFWKTIRAWLSDEELLDAGSKTRQTLIRIYSGDSLKYVLNTKFNSFFILEKRFSHTLWINILTYSLHSSLK